MSELIQSTEEDYPLTCRGDHAPSYVYRIIKEAYDDEDIEL
jgi:translation initiation factor eIF-2B subunit beta